MNATRNDTDYEDLVEETLGHVEYGGQKDVEC